MDWCYIDSVGSVVSLRCKHPNVDLSCPKHLIDILVIIICLLKIKLFFLK